MDEYAVSPEVFAALLLLPNIGSSQDAELKLEIDDDRQGTAYRIWVPRMTDADREQYTEFTGFKISPVDAERRSPETGWGPASQADLNRAVELAEERGLVD
jgi:hypothetical protein